MDNTENIPGTNDNPLGIVLREVTREEIEANCIDLLRFQNPHRYLTEDSLRFFKSEALRDLFVRIFWECPDNVVSVLAFAVAEAGDTPRFRAVRDTVLDLWVREGKLVFHPVEDNPKAQ